jgi:hypothetical protein
MSGVHMVAWGRLDFNNSEQNRRIDEGRSAGSLFPVLLARISLPAAPLPLDNHPPRSRQILDSESRRNFNVSFSQLVFFRVRVLDSLQFRQQTIV